MIRISKAVKGAFQAIRSTVFLSAVDQGSLGNLDENFCLVDHHLPLLIERPAAMGPVDSAGDPRRDLMLGLDADEITPLTFYEAVEESSADTSCLIGKTVCVEYSYSMGRVNKWNP